MPLFNFPLLPTEPSNDVASSGQAGALLDGKAFLGHGLATPFRRAAADIANASGEELVRSCVSQVLGTVGASAYSQGELPWRTDFGSLLHLLRHKNIDDATQALARQYVTEALRQWEPRVRVRSVVFSRDGVILYIRLRYDIIAANSPGNQVVVPNVDQVVALAA